MVFCNQGWSQVTKKTINSPCDSFRQIATFHEGGLALIDDEVRIFTTGYSRKSSEIYQRFVVAGRESKYIGILKIYPSTELLRFGELYKSSCVPQTNGSSPLRDFSNCLTENAKEIDSIFSSQEALKPEKIVTKDLSTFGGGPGDRRCDAFAIQSRLQLDGSEEAWFVFLRNYRLGRRLSTGRTYCDLWDQEGQQLLFYETFVPTVLRIDGKNVVVDEEFLGVLSGRKFEHVCELSQAVQSYAVDSGALLPTVRSYGDLCTAENGPSLWSCQVSRNILIGNQLLNRTVERPNLTPRRLPPAPRVSPRAN